MHLIFSLWQNKLLAFNIFIKFAAPIVLWLIIFGPYGCLFFIALIEVDLEGNFWVFEGLLDVLLNYKKRISHIPCGAFSHLFSFHPF